jgi:hypothetical protein
MAVTTIPFLESRQQTTLLFKITALECVAKIEYRISAVYLTALLVFQSIQYNFQWEAAYYD